MHKHIKKTIRQLTLIFSGLFLFQSAHLKAQSAGTYDNTFSGDGKQLYIPDTGNIIRPFVFMYNNEVITIYEKRKQLGSSYISVSEICMLKHDISGNFLSKKVIRYDTANFQYYGTVLMALVKVKMNSNGNFIFTFAEQNPTYYSNVTYPTYVYLGMVDASGNFNTSFDGDGILKISETFNQPDEIVDVVFDLYSNNSIFVAYTFFQNSTSSDKIHCLKVSTSGVITNTFTVGAGNYNYTPTDVKVNPDNSIYLAGKTTAGGGSGTHHNLFMFKLTPGFNYSTSFNTTGKLFINKGEVLYDDFLILNSTTTDLYTAIESRDTLGRYYDNNNGSLYFTRKSFCIQKYNTSGSLLIDKTLYTYTSNPSFIVVSIAGIQEDMNGKIMIYYTETDTMQSYYKSGLMRLNPSNLIYDTNFNFNGRKSLSFSSSDNYPSNFFIQPDNKILTVSASRTSSITINSVFLEGVIALARIHTNNIVTDINSISKEEFTLYPNPAKNELQLKLNDDEQYPVDIEFYNTNGQLVKKETIENETIRTSLFDVVDGLYIIKLSNSKGFNQTGKLLIQK